MNILVIDVGGTNVKILATGHEQPRKFASGPTLTAEQMVARVKELATDWQYYAASIGYPGFVMRGRPIVEPHNLAPGWVCFDFQTAASTGRPSQSCPPCCATWSGITSCQPHSRLCARNSARPSTRRTISPSRLRRALLILQAALLAACLGLGVAFGPFPEADRPIAVLVGMLAVAAMATQNAVVQLTLKDPPSTTIMTTNITQLAIDLTTLAMGRGDLDVLTRARCRASMSFPCVVGFVGSCAVGAVLEVYFGLWALALPVVLAALAVPLAELSSDGGAGLESKNGEPYNDKPTCAQASWN